MMQSLLPWSIAPDRPSVTDHRAACSGCALCAAVFADEVEADELAAEWARTARLAAAGAATATAISLAMDPAGTVAIVADLFRWWLL